MADLPPPLIPAEVDLRDFSFTPIFRARLFGSSFHARVSDAGWRAGVTLWLKSWDQVPSGTLPEDEIDLCRLAELARDLKTWRKVSKEALHGWFKCSDGRLHHRVVAEGVLEAWERRSSARRKGKAGASARWGSGNASTIADAMPEPSNSDNDGIAQAMPGDGKGQGQGQGQIPVGAQSASPAIDLLQPTEKQVFDLGRQVLKKQNCGGLVKKLIQSQDGDLLKSRQFIERASRASNPAEYIGAIISNRERDGAADPRGTYGLDYG